MKISRRLLERFIHEACCSACDDGEELAAVAVELAPEPPNEVLLSALTGLRAAYLVHQQAHWESRGPHYYGDHLLYERLYTSSQEDADELAERIAGLMGSEALSIHGQWGEMLEDETLLGIIQIQDTYERSLRIEEHALFLLEEAYHTLSDTEDMTLGLDDLLMSLCSNRETSLYLLRQRGA